MDGALTPGLCPGCAHGAEVVSARAARFWRCRRSEREPDFPRYPTLPVLRCPGFEPAAGPAAPDP